MKIDKLEPLVPITSLEYGDTFTVNGKVYIRVYWSASALNVDLETGNASRLDDVELVQKLPLKAVRC